MIPPQDNLLKKVNNSRQYLEPLSHLVMCILKNVGEKTERLQN